MTITDDSKENEDDFSHLDAIGRGRDFHFEAPGGKKRQKSGGDGKESERAMVDRFAKIRYDRINKRMPPCGPFGMQGGGQVGKEVS